MLIYNLFLNFWKQMSTNVMLRMADAHIFVQILKVPTAVVVQQDSKLGWMVWRAKVLEFSLNGADIHWIQQIFFFFKKFCFGPRSILWSHWLLLFWTSCVLPHGFQSQSGYLARTLSCLCAVILKVTTGATPAFSTNRGVHCISVYTAWLARLLSHASGFEPANLRSFINHWTTN